MLAILGLATGAGGAAAPLRTVSLDGVPYVKLHRAAAFYGMRVADAEEAVTLLRGRGTVLGLEAHSRRISVNGTRVWLHAPIRESRNRPAVARTDLDRMIDPLLRSHRHLEGYGARVVVLDPGHGGTDTGAVGPGGLRERM